ncbi:hypothetical protein Hanom_Chr04g00350511 [Helianthus anomalus]
MCLEGLTTKNMYANYETFKPNIKLYESMCYLCIIFDTHHQYRERPSVELLLLILGLHQLLPYNSTIQNQKHNLKKKWILTKI